MRTAQWNEPVSVVDRVFTVLDAVRAHDGSASITELAEYTRLPKSTVSRLVTSLVEHRYLVRAEGRVRLGLRLFELGSRAALPRRLRIVAEPVVRDLWCLTGERVSIAVSEGRDMMPITAVPGRLRTPPVPIGGRAPASTTATGKAVMAFHPDLHFIDDVTVTMHPSARAALREELVVVRATSVAVDAAMTFPGVTAIASPILAPDLTPVGALSLAGPSDSMDAAALEPLVRAAARNLTRRLAAAA